MKGASWSPAEDAVIREEVARGDAIGSRWADRAVLRLPGRSRPAVQVRASVLRVSKQMHMDTPPDRERVVRAPPPFAPTSASRVVPSGAGIPDFLADCPAFNRR